MVLSGVTGIVDTVTKSVMPTVLHRPGNEPRNLCNELHSMLES